MDRIIPVLHNVMSAYRIIESAKIVYGLGFRIFVVSKASGSAAQSGLPEAQRIAIRFNRNLVFLKDIDDVIEIFRPIRMLMVLPGKYGGVPLSDLEGDLKKGAILVFGGSEPGLSKREIEKGTLVYPDYVTEDLSPTGLLAITLYLATRMLSE